MQAKTTDRNCHLVGVISDTHGILRPEAIAVLEGVDLIIHAGDLGKLDILEGLQAIAPVVAVRGNVDRGAWADRLPKAEVVRVGSVSLYVLHILQELDLDPVAAGFRAIISGHSHQPALEERHGVLYMNPGSAGPRRFRVPASLALVRVRGMAVEAELIELEV